MSDGTCVMLAAGGTGGHLFPAYALAEELARRGIAVDLMTDQRGHRYGAGFPARVVHRVHSATLTRRTPLGAAQTAFSLARGTQSAYAILARSKPLAVVGFGGYPTWPPLAAARLAGVPTIMHEQNAVLGRANRLLARGATAIALSFENTKFLTPALGAKSRLTGNPVRQAVIDAAIMAYPERTATQPFHLVVFGGSQGARFFSESVPPALVMLSPDLRSLMRVTHQAREEDRAQASDAYAAAGIAADVAPFFDDLPSRIGGAHLVIGRAGASTVAELTVIGRPSILVPLPHALDNDQLNNAARLAESGGGWCIEQKDMSAARLGAEIARLASDPSALADAARAAKSCGRPDAVQRLADFVLETAGRAAPARGHGATVSRGNGSSISKG